MQALVGTGPMTSDTLLDWIDEINKLLERDVRNITHHAGDVVFLCHPTPLSYALLVLLCVVVDDALYRCAMCRMRTYLPNQSTATCTLSTTK